MTGWLVWLGLPLLAIGLAWTVRTMLDDAHRISRHGSHIKRVVDRKVAERTMKLEDEIEQYRALIENLDAVAFEYDVKDAALVYIAPQAARLLDCEPGELTLGHIMSTIHRDDRPLVDKVMRRGYHVGPLDCRQLTKRGRLIHTRTFLSARAGSRRIRGLTLDITHEKHLENELRQAQKLESVGRLSAGIAHEINSPIQYIGDSIDFVRDALGELTIVDDYLRENIPAALVRAADGVDRIARIVRSMKAFAHDKQDMTAVDIRQTVENTLTVSSSEYRYVADLVTDFDATPPVWCHAGDLQHVLVTIVVNAAQAIADGDELGLRRRGRITVRTRSEQDHVVISVADTGCGIPEHLRAQVFEPFFTTKGVGKGVGQDLAVAHALIVGRYHGSLTFESEVGNGTVFTVRLPAFVKEGRVAA